jgi:cytochrome c
MRLAISVGVLLAGLGGAALAADAEHGQQLFKACAACHTNKLGPALTGVVGRKAAALDDFRYSPAMQRSNIVWDDTNLREYITDPQGKVKGNRMPFAGLKNPQDADDVIAYLKTLK